MFRCDCGCLWHQLRVGESIRCVCGRVWTKPEEGSFVVVLTPPPQPWPWRTKW